MRRPALLALCLGLVASFAATEAPIVDSAVVATDACAAGPDLDDLMLDAHDLCDVRMTIVTSDAAPTVEIALRVADDVIEGTDSLATMTVGDCIVQVRHESDAAAPGGVFIYTPDAYVGCGEGTRSCTFRTSDPTIPVSSFNCTVRHDDAFTVDVAPPTITGDTITFHLPLDAELADIGAMMVPGAEVGLSFARVAPDLPFFAGGASTAVLVCGDLNDCIDVGGDVVHGDDVVTISDRD